MTGRRVPRPSAATSRPPEQLFSGASWRDQGRAWLAVIVADRLADPAPAAPDVEFIDDDDAPVPGLAIDSAADEIRPGGVGWKVWLVAAAAVVALVVMIIFAAQALGGPGTQVSPTPPPAPLFTPTDTPGPTDAGGLPTSIDTAGGATATPTPRPTATPAPTAAPEHDADHHRTVADSDTESERRVTVARSDALIRTGSVPQRDGVRLYTSRA